MAQVKGLQKAKKKQKEKSKFENWPNVVFQFLPVYLVYIVIFHLK